MLKICEHPREDVIEVIIDGRVERAEYEANRERVEAFIAARGRVRLLEVIRALGPAPPSVIWEDTAFAFRHWNDFSRIAVVTKEKWLSSVLAALQVFFAGEAKAFTLDQCEQAWAWLTEHAPRDGGRPHCLEDESEGESRKDSGRKA